MPLLVTGSIGIDTVKTPHGLSENCIGGSAIYFTMAASFFSHVRFIGVVGSDCPFNIPEIFTGKDVDLRGLEVRRTSKTFRWAGTYMETMDDRVTDYMELNVLAEHPPVVPKAFADSRFVFLANTAPRLQIELLSQIKSPLFVAADTMDCWITDHSGGPERADDKESIASSSTPTRPSCWPGSTIWSVAAEQILTMGPSIVIIKKGESGSLMCLKDGSKFVLPAYPATEVVDPTGAGDSFAGGLMGYLAQARKTDFDTLKTAVAYGTVVASFTIADFSLDGLKKISRQDIDNRLEMLRKFTSF